MRYWVIVLFCLLSTWGALGQGECGEGGTCPSGMCCSQWGYCGYGPNYCGTPPPPPFTPPPPPPPPTPPPPPSIPSPISSILNKSQFDAFFPNRDYSTCTGNDIFTYEAFIAAAETFPAFGTTGDIEVCTREIAAFLGQTSHETTGGWDGAPGGRYTWGYCFVREVSPGSDYCEPSNTQWPCVPGQQYYGRGPIQLSWNYNYGPAGYALGYNTTLLSNPDLVATNATLSFETALWFWMTPQSPKPSCHDVITGNWTPTQADINAGRLPGYGVLTNIINGGIECGQGGPLPSNDPNEDRIGFYTTYCNALGVSPGDNLDCYNQTPFGWGLRSIAAV